MTTPAYEQVTHLRVCLGAGATVLERWLLASYEALRSRALAEDLAPDDPAGAAEWIGIHAADVSRATALRNAFLAGHR